ncbi:MAG TPA: erythromycin esterase family protein [Rubricoccaceae bacterium]|jgi:protein-L-isoaspartate(D-aspartate) O-methyltransferase
MSRLPAHARPESDVYRSPADLARLVAEHAEPFDSVDDFDPEPILERIGDARVVCIGEATHGTSEFYRLRARITQALVDQKGFRIVAAEADWADAERIDAYVRGREPGETERDAFGRFPTWMWRNEEVRDFVEWLRDRNAGRDEAERAGFFGLDLYGLYESLHEVLRYLDATDPELAADARIRYGCLMPFEGDPAAYGRALIRTRYAGCESGVVGMLRDLLRKRLAATAGTHGTDDFPFFNATENARVVADAEAYYRESFVGGANTWNLRDTHMVATLQSLMDHVGDDAKAVVWAHNSHVGDALATQMGAQGDINVGHLCRQAFGDGAYLIGFGTHTGTVFAADGWGETGRVKTVRPSHPESIEGVAHASGVARFTLPLCHGTDDLRAELSRPRIERAIGVIYRPETELQSHYFAADLPGQFDEWIWLDETQAVTPLGPSHAPSLPAAHPFRLLAD